MGVGIGELVDAKVDEVAGDTGRAWAGCSALWTRAFANARRALDRWPALRPRVETALVAAVTQTVRGSVGVPPSTLPGVAEFDIEDDGSADWQYVVDLIAMLLPALDGRDASTCLRIALLTYLDGTFIVLANAESGRLGRPISETEAQASVEAHESWLRAVAFAQSL